MALQGSSLITSEIAFCHERSKQNAERLARAMAPHHPRLRDASAQLRFRLDAETILGSPNFKLTTDVGDIDFLAEVAGLGTLRRSSTLFGHHEHQRHRLSGAVGCRADQSEQSCGQASRHIRDTRIASSRRPKKENWTRLSLRVSTAPAAAPARAASLLASPRETLFPQAAGSALLPRISALHPDCCSRATHAPAPDTAPVRQTHPDQPGIGSPHDSTNVPSAKALAA